MLSCIECVQDLSALKKNRVAKEWNDASEVWVDFVRQGKDYFREELNNPGMLRLIGSVKGLEVLDIACGEGYNTRILARKGAKVTGVDLSRKLLKHAKSQEKMDQLGIRYYISNSADLSRFPAKRFDVVTCFMALMDIEDYQGTIREVARVMSDTGRFLFSIVHPCFDIIANSGEIEKTATYFGVRSEPVPWRMERLLRPFDTTSFHRTLTDYSTALHKHGLVIRRLLEPKPTRNGAAKFPLLKQVRLKPHSIIFETIKDNAKNQGADGPK